MTSLFTFRRTTRTDQMHRAFTFSMTYQDKPILGGIADRKKAVFTQGMIWIIKRRRKRIKKTVTASSKETPCFLRFDAAFSLSHSNRMESPYDAQRLIRASANNRLPVTQSSAVGIGCSWHRLK
jgi:hypothetical protein